MHHVTLKLLQYIPKCCFKSVPDKPVQVMGLDFKHPVGLAAGFDKDGRYLKALAKLGFAFIELGTVTPKPQAGNPKPRIFRLPKVRGLINRMGFNNAGVDVLVKHLEKTTFDGVIGVSIGPNKDTPIERVWQDCLYCLQRVYARADYIAVNISSPNTAGLRSLHDLKHFAHLMDKLREEQLSLADEQGRYVPILVKISPDEDDASLEQIAKHLLDVGLDGMMITNTTVSRAGLKGLRHAREVGGLSGKPLAERALTCLKLVKAVAGDDLVLVALGGIDSPDEAKARMAAGADLIQVYSGLVYEGPGLIARLVKGTLN
jgi:dihydroorotate dehydrogenase